MNKRSIIKTGLLFLLIGIGLIAGGIAGFFYSQSLAESRLEVTAEITEITNYHDQDETVRHDVYIRFETQDGEEIRTTLGSYSSSMEVGDEITVFYDPENPEKLHSATSGLTFVLICGGMGLACAAVGISNLVKARKKQE